MGNTTRNSMYFLGVCAGLVAAALFFVHDLASADMSRFYQRQIGVEAGIRSLGIKGAKIPVPASLVVTMDAGPCFRLKTEVSYLITEPLLRTGLGMGGAFTVYGTQAQDLGGLQIKVPALLEIGFLRGNIESEFNVEEEGYLNWVLLGLSTGIDLSFRPSPKVGVLLSLSVGYMFRIHNNAEISVEHKDPVGVVESACLVGVVF